MKLLNLKENSKSSIIGTLNYRCLIWELLETQQIDVKPVTKLLPNFVKSILINFCDGIGNSLLELRYILIGNGV